MKDVGKPCEGEPHARIDGGRLETERRPRSPQRSGPQGKPGEKWLRDLPPGNVTAPAAYPPRPGVSAAAFADLARYTQDRFWRWARRKHRRITMKAIRRRYCGGGWWPVTTEIGLFNPAKAGTTRYRYRGAAIPAPWPASG